MKYHTLLLLLTTSFLFGCATITQGTGQLISFSISPESARCELSREGDGILGSVNAAQSSIEVGKDYDDIVVVCSAPGYITSTSRLKSKTTKSGVGGAILLDLGIVDMMTGAMWAYPSHTSIVLAKDTEEYGG